jgi:hypothetical protein
MIEMREDDHGHSLIMTSKRNVERGRGKRRSRGRRGGRRWRRSRGVMETKV